jgi:hypothetical protein
VVVDVVVAILLGVVASLADAPEWVWPDALEWALGAAAIGMAAIGMAVTGVVAIGTAIGVIIDSITASSSSATSAFPDGGAGAAAGAGAILITDTVMAIRTVTTDLDMDIPVTGTAVTDMAITGTETVMDMATETIANTAPLPGQK